jgi:hypothetical protein
MQRGPVARVSRRRLRCSREFCSIRVRSGTSMRALGQNTLRARPTFLVLERTLTGTLPHMLSYSTTSQCINRRVAAWHRRAAECVLLAFAVVVAPGCVATFRPPPDRAYAAGGPPPAPIAEAPPPRPSAAHIWAQGYWHWSGVDYAWIPGHWQEPIGAVRWSLPTGVTIAPQTR